MLTNNQDKVKPHRIGSKLLWIALATACYSGGQAYADLPFSFEKTTRQEKIKIQGKVVDKNTNEPLGGVSIRVGGKAVGTTSADGTFAIEIATGSNISFQLIGYNTHAQIFNNTNPNTIIQLVENTEGIEEVVVTALGIKREEKSLGYSVTTVSGEELTNAQSANWTDALTGKVAGLNLTKSGAGPAGTNQIILRGENSLTGDNSALIVIDGVITSSSSGRMTTNGNSNYMSDDAPVDFGTGLADINPEDIESISVLKGPGATALYGARGANGAIVITTKKGKKNNGLGFSLTSNTSIGTINRWPDYQNQYGAGVGGSDFYYSYGQSEDGASTYSTSSAWGPKFNGQQFYQFNPDYYRLTPPERTEWRAYENNKRDFFETTVNSSNNLSYATSTEKTSTRISIGNTINKWMVPNTGFNRTTAAVQMSHKLTDKINISGKASYNNKFSKNLPTTGYNNGTIMYFIRGLTPNMNLDWFKNYWIEKDVEQNTPFSTLLDNPYLQSYEMLNGQNRDNFLGNAQVDYTINKEFSVMGRASIDFSYDGRTSRRPFDSNKFANGYFRKQNIFNSETNVDFLARYRNERNKDIKWGASVGGARMANTYRRIDLSTSKLKERGIYSLDNTAEPIISRPYRSKYAVNSIYGMANIEYKNFLFFDVTSRIDWSSTLASPAFGEGEGFMYNSYNGSVILSQLLDLPKSINFFKFRASLANVGSGGTTPFLTSYTYPIVPSFGNDGLSNSLQIPNESLKYESTRSVEFGTDLRMFKNRLTFDIAVYQNNTFNQILPVPIDPSSGFTRMVINAGEVRNRGAEFATSYQILKNKEKLNWKMFGNFSYNDGIIISLPESSEESAIILSTIYGSRGTIEARVGGNYGAMYGYGYKRSPDGQIIYKDGYPEISTDLLYLGRSTAPWKAAWGNEFQYKNWKFNFLFDGQFGGVGYSLTHAVLMEEGKLNKTIPGRYNGLVGKGVVDNGDNTFSPNTTLVNARDFYYNHFNRDNLEANTFSTNYIKLREVRIDYTFSPSFLKQYKFQRANLGLYGRDLFVFTNWPAFDPEFGSLTSAGIQKGAEVAQFPSTRNFGLSLTLNF